jgi:flagellar hook protein FlgE
MLTSVYTSLTGLMAFSQGLDVLSNNISNLNTAGYKGRQLMFRDVMYRYQLESNGSGGASVSFIGSGVQAEPGAVNEAQGEIRATGNPTDVAINGSGFFVLREADNVFYTRAGQFSFDTDGNLVFTGSSARVQGYDASGGVTDININPLRTFAPRATIEIKLRGNIAQDAGKYDVANVPVFDATGTEHKLTVSFVSNSSVSPRSWKIEIKDVTGAVISSSGEVRFREDGSPETGFNIVEFDYQPDGAPAAHIRLNIGDAGTFNGATSFLNHGPSDASVLTQDGASQGSVSDFEFDPDGTMRVKYTNGKDTTGARLALAWFSDVQNLQELGRGLFLAGAEGPKVVGGALSNGLGGIASKSIELSNVELTQQFTDLIIIQRGYQAASQIMTASNEMVQQLLESMGRK